MLNISNLADEELTTMKALLLAAHDEPVTYLNSLTDSEWNMHLNDLTMVEISRLVEPDRLELMRLLAGVMYD